MLNGLVDDARTQDVDVCREGDYQYKSNHFQRIKHSPLIARSWRLASVILPLVSNKNLR